MPASRAKALRFDFSPIQHTVHGSSSSQTFESKLRSTRVDPTSFDSSFGTRDRQSIQDVMRLTAIVDDLNVRLKSATDRANVAETTLKKTHATLVFERNSISDRINSMNVQLGAAHAVETQLREQLVKAKSATAAVRSKTTPDFRKAVSAAMVSEDVLEKSHNEIKTLKDELVKRDKDAEESLEIITKLRRDNAIQTDYASAADAMSTQYSIVVRELDDARNSEQTAKQELADVKVLLEQTKQSIQHSYTVEPQQQVVPVVVSCFPKCSTPVGCYHENETTPNVESVSDAPPAFKQEPQPVAKEFLFPLDPVKMHTRYNRMKDKMVQLTATIAKMVESGQSETSISSLVEVRDELYAKAKELKLRYDTVFGTVEPDSVIQINDTEASVRKPNATEEIEQLSYEPLGEPPDPPRSYVVSFARELATTCPLGGAFDVGSYDSGVGVGSAHVHPITVGECIVEASGEDTPDPTEVDKQQQDIEGMDMAHAVIKDLTRFLKHEKNRDDEIKALLFQKLVGHVGK